jgi:S1-C subfamily serine protease
MVNSPSPETEVAYRDPPPKLEKLLPVANATNQVLDANVRIQVGNGFSIGTGSGVLLNRGGRTWVLTAAHCVANLDTGSLYTNLEVSRPVYERGYLVGRMLFDAKVVEYSVEEDLALLLLEGQVSSGITFAWREDVPSLGTELMHVGNLIGEMERSFVTGLLSGHGRTLLGKHFWQTSVDAWPGSSGGGVYTLDGKLIGLLTMGTGPTLNYIIPVERIYAWAEHNNLGWLFKYHWKSPEDEARLEKILAPLVGVNSIIP